MKIKYARHIVAAALSVLISGCATKYMFNNGTYSTPEEALYAQKTLLSEYLDKVQPQAEPTYKTPLLLVTPDKLIIEATMINSTGNVPPSFSNYIVDNTKQDHTFFAASLKKANIFSDVVHKVSNNPVQTAQEEIKNYGQVMYLHTFGKNQLAWYVTKLGAKEPEQVTQDLTVDDGKGINPIIQGVRRSMNNLTNNNK